MKNNNMYLFLAVFNGEGSAEEALERFFNLNTAKAGMYYWRGQEIKIETEVDQPVWTDGEYTGRTPVSMKVLPRSLTVAVP